MNQILGMYIIQCTQKLKEYIGGLLLIEGSLSLALINKFTASAELHAEIDKSVILIGFKIVYNVGVVDILKRFYFPMDIINLLAS